MIIEILAIKKLCEFFGVVQKESMRGSIWHGVGSKNTQNESLVYGNYEHITDNYDWIFYDNRN